MSDEKSFLKMSASNLNTIGLSIIGGVLIWVGNTVVGTKDTVAEVKTSIAKIEERVEHTGKNQSSAQSTNEFAIADLRTRLAAVEIDLARLRAEIKGAK